MSVETTSVQPIVAIVIWWGQFMISLSAAIIVYKVGQWVENRGSND